MKRRLFNVLAAVSLLLAIAACCVWVRSWYLTDIVGFEHDWITSVNGTATWKIMAKSSRGDTTVFLIRSDMGPPPPHQITTHGYKSRYQREWQHYPIQYDLFPAIRAYYHPHRLMGFAYLRRVESFTAPAWMIMTAATLPTFALVVVFALLPLWRVCTAVAQRRRVLGNHCVQCGYDLRASPGRCPECGAVPAPPVAGR